MFYAIGRIIGLTLGYPLQLLFFKRKTYYEYGEDGSRTNVFKGGKLIISNHFNMFDYVLTSFIVYPRKLNVVASEHAFRNPWFSFGVRFFGAIKADRTTKSMRFVDESARIIKERRQLVQIFPEGRNTPDGNIHAFKPSYLVIAYRAGCPIVPIITDGNYGVFKRTSVIIGQEIDVSPFFKTDARTPSREELAAANEYVHSKVLELREELERLKNKKTEKRKND